MLYELFGALLGVLTSVDFPDIFMSLQTFEELVMSLLLLFLSIAVVVAPFLFLLWFSTRGHSKPSKDTVCSCFL
jgi:hypothetical protein